MRSLPIILLCLLLISCDYFKQGSEMIPVARVNNSYLYTDDINDLVPEDASVEDSIIVVNNYINRWATQQLLIDQAKINLTEEQQKDYERLIEQYKTDLYTEAYKNAIIGKQLDSTISEIEFRSFYEGNKENFRLNDELVQVRYVHVDEDYNKKPEIRSLLDRFNQEDIEKLSDLSLQFKAYNFNDSTWVKKEALIEAIPALLGKTEQVLKKSNFTQLQDSLGLYLVKIEDVLKINDIAPLSHIKPTIEQIILNKRKLELVKKLETDITKDALNNNKFETYTPQ